MAALAGGWPAAADQRIVQPSVVAHLDDNVLDNLDRAGARFDALGRQLLDG